MKRKRKLKRFVLPVVYFVLLFVFVASTYMTSSNKKEDVVEDINYVSNIIWSNDIPVIATDKVIQKPYIEKKVTIGKGYYDYKDVKEQQQNAIIYYEGSYIQNSGVDYILDKSFDIVSVYDGTVIKVEDNELLGKTIEIKHDNNIISVYQSLSEVTVNNGDTVTQGMKIGVSGTSKINSELGNHLHFEIYINGQVINPENCYNKKTNEL